MDLIDFKIKGWSRTDLNENEILLSNNMASKMGPFYGDVGSADHLIERIFKRKLHLLLCSFMVIFQCMTFHRG